MEFDRFKQSLDRAEPPAEASLALQALWQEARGDWHAAHKLAQEQDDADGAWVHAYLHRVEGDERNAAGWYRRADKPFSKAPLPDEWEAIARALCAEAE
jgi:hypothetical protein